MAEGCYCEHHWLKGRAVERCENKGKLANPFYKAYSKKNTCITQAEFDAEERFVCTGQTDQTCTELYGDSRSFASAYLASSGEAQDMPANVSKYETGAVHFQEMCADDENGTCGGDPCDGVCVTGVFFGIPDDDRSDEEYSNYLGLHVHEYATRK